MRHLFREWEDGAVFYDRQTGDTHALDPLALEILKLPSELRHTAFSAAETLASQLTLPIDQNLQDSVAQAFSLLIQRELI